MTTVSDLSRFADLPIHSHQRSVAVYLSDYLDPGYEGGRCEARNKRGELVPPPSDHILDHLVRHYDLLPEEVTEWSDGAGTVWVSAALPLCDICGQTARYDCPSTPVAPPYFLCPDCWSKTPRNHLSLGEGTYLMLLEEVPGEVRAICDGLTTELRRMSLWA